MIISRYHFKHCATVTTLLLNIHDENIIKFKFASDWDYTLYDVMMILKRFHGTKLAHAQYRNLCAIVNVNKLAV